MTIKVVNKYIYKFSPNFLINNVVKQVLVGRQIPLQSKVDHDHHYKSQELKKNICRDPVEDSNRTETLDKMK